MGWCQRGPPDLALEGGKPQIVGDVAYGAARNLSGFACDDSLCDVDMDEAAAAEGPARALLEREDDEEITEEDLIAGLIDERSLGAPCLETVPPLSCRAYHRRPHRREARWWRASTPAARRHAPAELQAALVGEGLIFLLPWRRRGNRSQPSDFIKTLHVLPGQIFGLFLGLVFRLPLEVGQLLAAHALHALFAATALEPATPFLTWTGACGRASPKLPYLLLDNPAYRRPPSISIALLFEEVLQSVNIPLLPRVGPLSSFSFSSNSFINASSSASACARSARCRSFSRRSRCPCAWASSAKPSAVSASRRSLRSGDVAST